MTPCELYHRLQYDVVFSVKPEFRHRFLRLLAAGFNEEGDAVPLSDHRRQQIDCLWCSDYDTEKCTTCGQFLVAAG
jgi:hypothetical protein